MSVYVVMCSNCEAYEDYHEWIDSIWSTRNKAITHITQHLEMEQHQFQMPERPHTRDRWKKDIPYYPTREECEDEEEWQDCFDENGKLIPIYVETSDAWILEFNVDPAIE